MILGLLGTYLSFSAIKKLDQAEQSLEEARREIQAAQSQMGEVIKDIQKEKERLLYFKNQFDHIRTELKVFEAKNKVEKDSAIHKLDVLKTTGDSLAKLLGI